MGTFLLLVNDSYGVIVTSQESVQLWTALLAVYFY